VRLNWVEAEALEKEGGVRLLDERTASSCPADSVARHARHDEGAEYARDAPASRSSGSATASSGRPSNSRATCAASRGADSTEVDENAPHKVIYKLRDLLGVDDSAARCVWDATRASWRRDRSPRRSTASADYERHRHRFEFNCLYEIALAQNGHAGVRPLARRQVRRDRRAARALRGSSPCSSILSSSPSRSSRIRCSRASSSAPSAQDRTTRADGR
jgi:CTP synthase